MSLRSSRKLPLDAVRAPAFVGINVAGREYNTFKIHAILRQVMTSDAAHRAQCAGRSRLTSLVEGRGACVRKALPTDVAVDARPDSGADVYAQLQYAGDRLALDPDLRLERIKGWGAHGDALSLWDSQSYNLRGLHQLRRLWASYFSGRVSRGQEAAVNALVAWAIADVAEATARAFGQRASGASVDDSPTKD